MIYWIYWESKNGKIPPIVARLIRIFKKKMHTLNVVNNKTITDYISVVDTSKLEHIAQKVDYYRGKLLYTYGGMWIDIDTIILDNLDYLFEQLEQSDKEVCVSTGALHSTPPVVCLQYLLSKPNSQIMREWYSQMEKCIIANKTVSYAYFGTLLANIIIQKKLRDTILPFPDNIAFRFGCKNVGKYYKTDRTFIDESIQNIKKGEYKIIILYGSGGLYHKPYENTVLSKFFEYAETL